MKEPGNIYLYNSLGQLINVWTVSGENTMIKIDKLGSGMYYLSIEMEQVES